MPQHTMVVSIFVASWRVSKMRQKERRKVSEIGSINIVNSNRRLCILGALNWYINKDLVS